MLPPAGHSRRAVGADGRRAAGADGRRAADGPSHPTSADLSWRPLGLALLIALAAIPVPVSAHVNDVSADPQVSADGTVIVETVFIGSDGWVVLYRVNGSDPGDPIGHAAVSREGGLKTDVRVRITPAAWRNWSGNRTVWAVLHKDDGDGQFEPSDDEVIEQFGEPAGQRFVVRAGDSPSYVTAQGFGAQQTADGTVTVRAVALPGDGYVVVRNATGDGPGAVVGRQALPEGTSHNVSVELDPAFFRSRRGEFALLAVAYVDDGDGSFDSGDGPVRVGSDAVQSRFGVEKTGGPTPTPTEESDSGGDPLGTDDGTAHEHSPTTTARPTPTSEATATPHGDRPTTTGTDATAPGLGFVAGLASGTLAVVLALAAALFEAGRY